VIGRISFALVACAAAAYAEPAADVTADQAVALYRAHSARLLAVRAAVDVARADVVEARIHPNPTLGAASVRTVGGSDTIGGSQQTLSIDIPILIGRQRSRREAAARRHIDVARAQVELDQADAELDIRARFAALLAAQEQAAVLTGALADARAVRAIVAARASAGAGSEYALERIDLAIAILASRVDEAASDEASRAGELATAVGLPGWHPHAIGELGDGGAAVPPLAAEHPALVVDRRTVAAARADLARAHADAIPTPSFGLQAFGTTDPAGMAFGAGISMPLPLFDRNQGAIARARAEAHRAEFALEARAAELASELARASRVLAIRREAVARFRADALQRLDKLRAMAEASYRSGQGGIVELLDALDAITEARLHDIELRAAVVEAELAVRRAATGH
jgi:cobalt-zinc-cadmium efflux system outer membrane protein